MKKLNLDKVKEMAGKVLPKKSDEPEAEVVTDAVAEAVEEAALNAVEPAAEAEVEAAVEAVAAAEPVSVEAEEAEPEKSAPKKAEKPEKPVQKAAKPAKAKQPPKGKPEKKNGAKGDECVFKFPTLEQMKNPAFLIPTVAGLLLILAWCFSKNALVRGILGGLSAIATLYVLFPDILKAVRAKDWRSGLLILVLSAVLYALAGGIPGAATALLLWFVGQKALDCLKQMKQEQLIARRSESPLSGELPAFDSASVLTNESERSLSAYFTILAIFLAAVVAVIAALTKAGFTGALRRAASILMLGSTASFFAGFPFGDLNSLLNAAENGVLFRSASLPRALSTKLCCVTEAEPEMFGDVAVYPTVPEKLNGETLVKLAALAFSQSNGLWAEKLASICEAPAAEGLETKALEGYGIAAKVNNLTVLCGSAEFMAKAELPVLPFRTGENVLHIGVNNFYAGCMELGEAELSEDALDSSLKESGFFRFADEADAAANRQAGETVLFAAPDGKPEGCTENDLYVSSGSYQTEADIVLSRCGVSGILALTAQLRQTGKLRKLLVSLALYVKAVLFLLAVFGVCPLWLAALLELGLSAFGVYLGSKSPKVKE